jgi:type III secretion system low calcium response chaperone LcrH/SycD
MTVPHEKLAEQICDLLLNGGTLGDVYDYTEEDYEVMYALGHSLYSQARYSDAMKVFGFLVIHNHLERRFVTAFASSLHMIKAYEEAIKYYSLSSVMDMGDPVPTFHTAECMIAIGMVDDAIQALGMVIKQSGDEPHAALRVRAEALLEMIAKSTVKGTQP